MLRESLEYAMFLKRAFSHYKQEVMVLKESLECAMFLKRKWFCLIMGKNSL